MIARLLLALAFCAAVPAFADVTISGGAAGGALPQVTVAGLPTCDATTQGSSRVVTDALNETSCTVGGGTADNTCDCIDGVWTLRGTTSTVADGDKGDVNITGGSWEIDAGVVAAPEIATDGVAAAEVAADAVGTSEIATDGVSAAELNATGVEAELEAALDLQDIAGAVTDAQVPNTVTIDNAAGLDAAGARLIYKAAGGGTAFEGDCFVEDVNDNGTADNGEQCVTSGDHIANGAGGQPQNGAVAYYARDFDTAASLTDGLQEAVNHCIATVDQRGCIILLGRGTYDLQAQLSFVATEPATTPTSITIRGAGIGRSGGSGTRVWVNAALTTANSNCSGEEGGTFTDATIPVCAGILVVGWNHRFQDLEILTAAAANADVLMELASRSTAGPSSPANMDTPAVYSTSHTILDNVRFTDGDLAQVYWNNRDNQAASQSDANDWRHVSFGAPNFVPRYSVFIDNQNTSVNKCDHCHFRDVSVANINVRQGEGLELDWGFSESAGIADAAKYMYRYCSDKITDTDSSLPGAVACGDLSGANWKRGGVSHWHHETTSGHGGFFFHDGSSTTPGLALEFYIRDSSIQQSDTATKMLDWDGVGALDLTGNSFINNTAGLTVIDIDCDGCSGANNRNQLQLTWIGNTPEPTDIDVQIDVADAIVIEGMMPRYAVNGLAWSDTNGNGTRDVSEGPLETFMLHYWVEDAAFGDFLTSRCLQYAEGNNNNVQIALPLACTSTSNASSTMATFPLNRTPVVTGFSCLGVGGGVTDDLTMEIAWRKGDAIGTQTEAGSLLMTASDWGSTIKSTALATPSVCPYAANGCGLGVKVDATTLSAGTLMDLNCDVQVQLH